MNTQPYIAPLFLGNLITLNSFILLAIIFGASIGLLSQKTTIAAYGGMMVFTHITLKTDFFVYNSLFYLLVFLMLLTTAFRVMSYVNNDAQSGEE